MKNKFWLLLFAALVWGAAVSCSPAAEEDSSPPASSENNNENGALNTAPEAEPDVFPRATLTPPPVGEPSQPEGVLEGYPPPLATPLTEGYDIPATALPFNPYPEASGTLIWIIKPVGEQCAETPATPDLQTAVADMVAFDIPVEASEMTELTVCAACGCPTSAHFRLQIDSGYLGNAELLGWVAEE